MGKICSTRERDEVCIHFRLQRKRVFGQYGHIWENNIKTDIRETVRTGFNWLNRGYSGRLL